MWTDGTVTRLRLKSRERPTLIEFKDDKQASVNFQEEAPGLYIVTKVVGDGFLKLGDKRLPFTAPTNLSRGY
jgi:hypothetical protein